MSDIEITIKLSSELNLLMYHLTRCAVGGKADVIVSGDKDLLVLNPYQNIAILNAEAFLKRLTGE